MHSLRATVPTPRDGNNSRLYETVPGHSGLLLSHWLRHIGLISSRYPLPRHTFQLLLSPNSTHTVRLRLPGLVGRPRATCVPRPAHLHRTSSPAPAPVGAAPHRAARGRGGGGRGAGPTVSGRSREPRAGPEAAGPCVRPAGRGRPQSRRARPPPAAHYNSQQPPRGGPAEPGPSPPRCPPGIVVRPRPRLTMSPGC